MWQESGRSPFNVHFSHGQCSKPCLESDNSLKKIIIYGFLWISNSLNGVPVSVYPWCLYPWVIANSVFESVGIRTGPAVTCNWYLSYCSPLYVLSHHTYFWSNADDESGKWCEWNESSLMQPLNHDWKGVLKYNLMYKMWEIHCSLSAM